MLNREQLSQDYEDSLLRMAMLSYAEQEGMDFIAEAKKLREQPNAPKPSKKELAHIKKAIRASKRKQIFLKQRPLSYKWSLRIAAVLIILSILLMGTLTVSSSFRDIIFRWLFVRNDTHVLTAMQNNYAFAPAPQSTYHSDMKFVLNLLPIDFKETNVSKGDHFVISCYENHEGNFIEFYQSTGSSFSSAKGDSEDAEFYAEILLDEKNPAILYVKQGITSLIWNQDNTILRLKSDLDSNIIRFLAQSVKKFK